MPSFPFALISVFRVTTLYLIIILTSLLTSPIGYNDIIITYAQEEIEGVNASIRGEEERGKNYHISKI